MKSLEEFQKRIGYPDRDEFEKLIALYLKFNVAINFNYSQITGYVPDERFIDMLYITYDGKKHFIHVYLEELEKFLILTQRKEKIEEIKSLI